MRYITTYAIPILCSAVLCSVMPFAASAQTYTTAFGATTTMSTSATSSDLGNAANMNASSSASQSSSASTTGVMNPAATSSLSNDNATGSAAIATAVAASHLYYYVNTRGLTAAIIAPDATTALSMATDIDPHSGVALAEGALRPGMKVESVK